MPLDKIISIISEQLNVPKEKINEASRFSEDLGADSLDIFQIITELEDEFGLEFSNEALDSIRTVGDAAEYAKTKLGEK
ncbi:MAG: acyl carrier protein [Defluviitaleaceae bacterium]|nr:acyl carrier protein [Defluviitaleaceae bacterium]